MKPNLAVLIVEDSPDDLQLVVRELCRGGYDVHYEQVDNAQAMAAALQRQKWDLVISDHSMPHFSSGGALQQLKEADLDLPFLIVSGNIGEETAVSSMKAGAHDYIMKGNLSRLVPAVARELRDAQMRAERLRTEQELQETLVKLQKAMEGTIYALAATLELRDPYTAGHQQRVANLACAIGREMGYGQLETLRLAGSIHDVGKISIPSEILSKPGRLSNMELMLIQGHAQAGYDILKDIDFPTPIAQIVLQHHERMDGSGYPQGLAGEAILPEARIIGVADVVEAMSSHRPYRPALRPNQAMEEILANRGRLYDPEAVDACVSLFTNQGYKLT